MGPAPRLLRFMLAGLGIAALPIFVPSLWVAVVGLWATLLVFAGWDAWAIGRVNAVITALAPTVVGVGDDCAIDVTAAREPGPTVHARFMAEVTAPLVSGDSVAVSLTSAETKAELLVGTSLRGEGTIPAIWSCLVGPFGFMQRIARHELDLPEVAVVPNVERLRDYVLPRLADPNLRAGTRIERRFGSGSELDSIQAYVRGMDVRHVDWKSSARHNALCVRRFRNESNQHVVVCLDTGRLMGTQVQGVSRLDHAIHAGLLLAEWALRNRDLVGLHAYGAGPRVWVPSAASMRQSSRLKHASAALRSEDDETNHALGLQSVLQRLSRRSLVVVFTDFVDSTSAELMVEYLGQLARKHVVVFVAIDDPALESPLENAPNTVEDLGTAVIAHEMRRARLAVLAKLRHVGIGVIHGPPGRVALDLLAKYVDVKQKGLVG